MIPVTRFQNSVTYEFPSEKDAEMVAAKFNEEEDHDNVAVARRNRVAFMGPKFKKKSLATFETHEERTRDVFGDIKVK
jgi:hypothetical protein